MMRWLFFLLACLSPGWAGAADSSSPSVETMEALRNSKRCIRCPLQGGDWHGANLDGYFFQGSILDRANFSAATAQRTNFYKIKARDADFSNADLHDATFENADSCWWPVSAWGGP
ncbi:MAG: pentapeptide repeat-containing protein [Magnetococcus sp. XQGC-1]